jgi:hypothetical protein
MEDLKEMFYNFGMLQYSKERISLVLSKSVEEVSKMLNSEFKEPYTRGEAVYEYKVDLKLSDLAIKGDIKALTTLEQRKNKRKRASKAS